MAAPEVLVTCIMPTRDRTELAAHAARCFLDQSHATRELVVVDDGREPVQDVLPRDARIRVIQLEESTSTGRKRNLGCAAARGAYIAHWDADAWYSPQRLRHQLATLGTSGGEAIGLGEALHYSPRAGTVWLRPYQRAGRPGVAGGSLLYARRLWEKRPYPDVETGDDEVFLDQVPAGGVVTTRDLQLYVRLLHPGGPRGRAAPGPGWHPRPLDDVRDMLAADGAFLARLRNGSPAPAPAVPRAALTLAAGFMVCDGYGSMAEYIALGIDRLAVPICVVPYRVVERGLTRRLLEIIGESALHRDVPLLSHSTVDAGFHLFHQARDVVISTMWESDTLPSAWLPAMQSARALVSPTRWCADLFRRHGLTRPVHTVPDGVDPAVYHYSPPRERAGLTTLMVSTNVPRKHLRQGLLAWQAAFEGDREARLLVKTHQQLGTLRVDDHRVSVTDVDETTRGIPHWYRRADILLALGNEGSGLPMLEAMACGLTVIALDAEGQSDTCADARGLVLPVPPAGREAHVLPSYGRCGWRSVPDVEAVSRHLRWVARHRDEARDMGRAASEWVLRHRDVWRKGPAMLDVAQGGGRRPSP